MGLTTHLIRGARSQRLLYLMHGIGADEKDLAGVMPYLDPEGNYLALFPRAPYGAPPGYAWFHMDSEQLMGATAASSLDTVDSELDVAAAEHGLPRNQAVVGGFSQGAAMGLALAFRRGDRTPPAGVLMMSGFPIPFDFAVPADPPSVLIQHGSQDDMIPVEASRGLAEQLGQMGVPVVYREYPFGHQVSAESARDAAEWLASIARGEKPSDAGAVPTAEPEPEQTGPVRNVRPEQFEAQVLRSPDPVIVEFWSSKSGAEMSPVVEAIILMRRGRYVGARVNVDTAPQLVQALRIQSLPAVAMVRNGRVERVSVGIKTRPQLEAELGMLVIP